MSFDNILLIPYLSKELCLLGHNKLPFNFRKKKRLQKSAVKKYNNLVEKESLEIVFDNHKMISELVTVCIDLVKQVKSFKFTEIDDYSDKIKFENIKLQKQLESFKVEEKKNIDMLALTKENNRQLQEKINILEKQLRKIEINKKQISEKCLNSEKILKHNLRKQKSELTELHQIIWNQFNLADKNYFPENFSIVQLNQPDFNKLWSDVKYSCPTTKEQALKKAVCIFQENNNLLMEDNQLLKNLLLITLDELNEITELILQKMCLSEIISKKINVNEIFSEIEQIDIPRYKKAIKDNFKCITDALNLFEKASFNVSDELFICWNDIAKKAINLLNT